MLRSTVDHDVSDHKADGLYLLKSISQIVFEIGPITSI